MFAFEDCGGHDRNPNNDYFAVHLLLLTRIIYYHITAV